MDYGTWFGGNVEYIHCIQMLPFTPITEELLRKEWVEEEYPVVAEAYNRGDPPLSEEWKVFSFQDLYYGHVGSNLQELPRKSFKPSMLHIIDLGIHSNGSRNH